MHNVIYWLILCAMTYSSIYLGVPNIYVLYRELRGTGLTSSTSGVCYLQVITHT